MTSQQLGPLRYLQIRTMGSPESAKHVTEQTLSVDKFLTVPNQNASLNNSKPSDADDLIVSKQQEKNADGSRKATSPTYSRYSWHTCGTRKWWWEEFYIIIYYLFLLK
jgi:hypothetical protein